MKVIGLIGGMSWESSLHYYRIINETVRVRLGGLHSGRVLMYSVDFAEIEDMQQQARWSEAAVALSEAAQRLERGGADCVLICTNTMHKVAEQVQESISLPLVHIADATAAAILVQGIEKVGLLGTRFTMEEDFYQGRLREHYGLEVLVPEADERELVHRVIYDELCVGVVRAASKQGYLDVIASLVSRGAEAIIGGCTEIGLLVQASDCPVPFFDTAYLHAVAAVDFALAPE